MRKIILSLLLFSVNAYAAVPSHISATSPVDFSIAQLNFLPTTIMNGPQCTTYRRPLTIARKPYEGPQCFPKTLPYEFKPDGRCGAENEALAEQNFQNKDVHIRNDASLLVMFHGNRYSVADEIVATYEKLHPGIKISYTSLPPIWSFSALSPPGEKATISVNHEFGSDINNPDVVMLPTESTNVIKTADSFGIYSKVHGVVMLNRADDFRVTSLEDALKNFEVRFVFPGNNPTLALWEIEKEAIGDPSFDRLLKRPRTGFSNYKHHRYIPLRIAAKCEDVGFQYLHSKLAIERNFPGVFKFTNLTVNPQLLAYEDSSVFVVKASTHRKEAERFAQFMLSAQAQAILKKYDLAINE